MHAQFDEAIRNALIVRIVFAPASEVSPPTLIARAWWRGQTDGVSLHPGAGIAI
ncbi:hypothetical protein [Corynebacterium endometrii]|uniref:hypothetical protein n=1 Tax=Corynebacterium endometrii TaxID=2488819 RepID=UPI0014482F5D|nr:hypothetical protein [Corynebacterium endometrii]